MEEVKAIAPDALCPICHNIVFEAFAFTECLHSICKTCHEEVAILTKCPLCQTASKRTRNHALANLMEQVYPDEVKKRKLDDDSGAAPQVRRLVRAHELKDYVSTLSAEHQLIMLKVFEKEDWKVIRFDEQLEGPVCILSLAIGSAYFFPRRWSIMSFVKNKLVFQVLNPNPWIPILF